MNDNFIPFFCMPDITEEQTHLDCPEKRDTAVCDFFTRHIVSGDASLLFGGAPVLDSHFFTGAPLTKSRNITCSIDVRTRFKMIIDPYASISQNQPRVAEKFSCRYHPYT